jgi:hypothetical protein
MKELKRLRSELQRWLLVDKRSLRVRLHACRLGISQNDI